jgi:hypothetical protein
MRGELYDLEEDPGETRNVFDDPLYRDDRARLTEDILAWLIRTEQPIVWSECLHPVPPFRWYRDNPKFKVEPSDESDRLRE